MHCPTVGDIGLLLSGVAAVMHLLRQAHRPGPKRGLRE
jgi:hypothetical protein